MRPFKRLWAGILSAVLAVSLAGCEDSGKVQIRDEQTGSEDFQKNLHQYANPDHIFSFVETDVGYYFVSYGSLYFLERESKNATIVCAKPDCDHLNDETCNARIHARYLLSGGEQIRFVATGTPKMVQSVRPDATGLEDIQALKFQETSASQSSFDQAIYHRGYVYYVSDDILYQVKLGGEKDDAQAIWSPENAGETQSQNGITQVTGNELHYKLWAEEETLYFMVNLPSADGTYKDTLFACDLSDLSVQQVWITPDKDQVGEWERTGVTVNQWYESGGYLYFYLGGNGIWRTELSTGETRQLADTREQAAFGSAVFSESAVCVLNDIPKFNEFADEPHPGSYTRFDADTVFLYGLDGTFRKEISLQPLLDELEHASFFDLLFCDDTDLYFVITAYTYDDPNNPDLATGRAITLCRVNYETGTASQVCRLA